MNEFYLGNVKQELLIQAKKMAATTYYNMHLFQISPITGISPVRMRLLKDARQVFRN